MIKVRKSIRSVYAYTLLLVMSMQWLAGSMYLKATYLVEIKPEMSITEKAIANAILDQYGFVTHVNVIDECDREFINGMGYAAPFVHSVEMNGTVNSFTLTNNEATFQNVEMTVKKIDDMPHQQESKQCVEKLFMQFCFGENTFTRTNTQPGISQNSFSVIPIHDICDHSDPSPPPRLA